MAWALVAALVLTSVLVCIERHRESQRANRVTLYQVVRGGWAGVESASSSR